jgi:transcription initiation factor TFIIIB Brf1 subunit/transcription initiation factor TFIIB
MFVLYNCPMICPKCDYEQVASGDNYCAKCGTALAKAGVSTEVAAAEARRRERTADARKEGAIPAINPSDVYGPDVLSPAGEVPPPHTITEPTTGKFKT